jgi:hypothetical protein
MLFFAVVFIPYPSSLAKVLTKRNTILKLPLPIDCGFWLRHMAVKKGSGANIIGLLPSLM